MKNVDSDSETGRASNSSDTAVLVVGVLMLFLLLPLVLVTVGYPWTAFTVAALLLGVAAMVKPEGNAAPLRWIPAGLGLFALVGGLVGLFL